MCRTSSLTPLLLLLLAWLAVPIGAADSRSHGSMADTMLQMMEAMGRFSRDYIDSPRRGQGDTFQPWDSIGSESTPRPPVETAPPSRPAPRSGTEETPLEGDWLGQGGERLAIRGSHFRLDAGPERILEGVLQIRRQLLALHSPQHRQTWIYEYAEHQGRLALRSAGGQLLLFRRTTEPDAAESGPRPVPDQLETRNRIDPEADPEIERENAPGID